MLQVINNSRLSCLVLCFSLSFFSYAKAQTFPTDLFEKAMQARENKKAKFKKDIVCLVDFSLPSYEKRLWIVEISTKDILLNTWVSHGRGSGKTAMATTFSNKNKSHCSSLGTYVTAEPFEGIHGKSLRLIGLDKEVNDNAEARGIIFHAAPYMSQYNALVLKRQGVSWGCFVVRPEELKEVIALLKNGAMIYAGK